MSLWKRRGPGDVNYNLKYLVMIKYFFSQMQPTPMQMPGCYSLRVLWAFQTLYLQAVSSRTQPSSSGLGCFFAYIPNYSFESVTSQPLNYETLLSFRLSAL